MNILQKKLLFAYLVFAPYIAMGIGHTITNDWNFVYNITLFHIPTTVLAMIMLIVADSRKYSIIACTIISDCHIFLYGLLTYRTVVGPQLSDEFLSSIIVVSLTVAGYGLLLGLDAIGEMKCENGS
jgi:hypothetical protein